jgi:hypothetical protein
MFSGGTPDKPATITHGELATRMGYPSPVVGLSRPLALIGRLCLQTDLPSLGVVVVSDETGTPGAEVLLRPGSTVELDQAAVMNVDWFSWRAPSAGRFRTVWGNRQAEEGTFQKRESP